MILAIATRPDLDNLKELDFTNLIEKQTNLTQGSHSACPIANIYLLWATVQWKLWDFVEMREYFTET